MRIDWELRRYEIARDIFVYLISSSKGGKLSDKVHTAVVYADTLIEELKKGGQHDFLS